MPLDVGRFRDSDLVTEEDPEAVLAAIMLWGTAWHQVPAASVPDNDRWLAKAAGYGRATDSWARIRAGALRGFVKCSDGRLYNKTLAEKANASWDSRLKHDWNKAADRHRKSERDLPANQKTKFMDFDDWKARRTSADVPPEFQQHSGGTAFSGAPIASGQSAKVDAVDAGKSDNPEDKVISSGTCDEFRRNDSNIPTENALNGREGKGRDYRESPTDSSISDADLPDPVLLPALIDIPDDAQVAFERHDAMRRKFVTNARAVDLSPDRKRKLAARLKEIGGIGGWDEVLSIIRASPFLRGDTSRDGFVAKIDWLLTPANLRKVREGNYDHDEHAKPPAGRHNGRSVPRSPIDGILAAHAGRDAD